MQSVPELCEVYQKTLMFLYSNGLQPFYMGAIPQKDLTRTNKCMASVEHTVGVNTESVVDMETIQFNYKLFCVATQNKNLPLPPCKYIIPMYHSYWNRVKPVSDIKTQMMWDMNFVTPVHSL